MPHATPRARNRTSARRDTPSWCPTPRLGVAAVSALALRAEDELGPDRAVVAGAGGQDLGTARNGGEVVVVEDVVDPVLGVALGDGGTPPGAPLLLRVQQVL